MAGRGGQYAGVLAALVLVANVVGCGGKPAAREFGPPANAQGVQVGQAPPDVGSAPASPAVKTSHPGGIGPQAKLRHRKVCPHGKSTRAVHCMSQVATDKNGKPLTFPKPDDYSLPGIFGSVWAFGPKDYHTAYSLTSNAKVQQTIGIVIWGHDPSIKKDLDAFDSAFGLGSFPTCTSWTWAACFIQVNQGGSASGPWPTVDPDTTLETSLDVEYAHAMCLNCRIILVEAKGYYGTDPVTGQTYFSATATDLDQAENEAYALHSTEINNSFGASEADPDCHAELTSGAFNHPGVAIVASSGDGGYDAGPQCPADFNTVVAVGGTDLTENSDWTYSSETVFYDDYAQSGPGSGCGALAGARSFQTSTANWSQTGCGSKRGIADVAASYGGAWVYDSTAGYNNDLLNPNATNSYWYVLYGTSLAAPIISGAYGLAGNGWTLNYPAQLAYQHPSSLHDVTTGSNSSLSCGTSICQAIRGYDGPTGLGSPYGLGGF